ncbi:PASTA domain-containing protein [Rubrobacter tropicus]|uniref:PASTA domain-containing protein n=1 Tax=Rubrobacter tropicus TaxID=2653851 RepID=UPI0014097CD5|nr:PASTA domain-containing protein [Rubrobacter tropicus]
MKILEGSIYSVDEVSDLLGIPRPTLYRYLREYSIPHLRRGGRIQIPEDSFDRIREARDLHKEGLGTDSVRRQLREGGGPDTEDIDRRLDSLHDTLEDLRGELRERPATGEVALSPALQTVLARQSLMLSAMFNLTGMVEDLLLANSRPRRRTVQRIEGDRAISITIAAEERNELSGTVVAEQVPVREAESPPLLPPTVPEPPARFGALARRRRRSVLALLCAAALALLLVLFLPALGGGETAATDQSVAGDAGGRKTSGQQPAGAEDERDAPASDDGKADNGTDDGGTETTGDVASASEDGDSESGPAPAQQGAAAAPAAPEPDAGVPDVTGQPVEEAARNISDAGYTVAAIRARTGPEEPGTVTGTEPSAGTDTPSGAPIVLTMSTGPTGASPASATASANASSSATASASASTSASAGAGSTAGASAPPSP